MTKNIKTATATALLLFATALLATSFASAYSPPIEPNQVGPVYTYTLPGYALNYTIIQMPPPDADAINPYAYNIVVYEDYPPQPIQICFLEADRSGAVQNMTMTLPTDGFSTSIGCTGFPTQITMHWLNGGFPSSTPAPSPTASPQVASYFIGTFTYQLPNCTIHYGIVQDPPPNSGSPYPSQYFLMVNEDYPPYPILLSFHEQTADGATQKVSIILPTDAFSSDSSCTSCPWQITMTPAYNDTNCSNCQVTQVTPENETTTATPTQNPTATPTTTANAPQALTQPKGSGLDVQGWLVAVIAVIAIMAFVIGALAGVIAMMRQRSTRT